MEKVPTGCALGRINIGNYIPEIGKTTKKKVMVYSSIKMEVATMDSGKIQKETERDL